MFGKVNILLRDPANMEVLSHDLDSASGTSYNLAVNLYQKPRLNHPGPVKPENKVKRTRNHYVIEKLLGKKTS